MTDNRLLLSVNLWLDASGWRSAWAWGIALGLALRLGLGLWLAIVWVTLKPYLPPGRLADPAVYDGLPTYSSFPGDALLGVWVRWDAVHYLNLARLGYFGVARSDSVYYPLYPLLTRLATWATGGDYVVGGSLISLLSAVATFACLYRLAEQWIGAAGARRTVLALAIYPTAIFLVAPFTEALFLALTLGTFLAASERNWWRAGVLGALAGLTRGPGVLTAAALAWTAWEQWKSDGVRLSLDWMSARRVIAPIAGVGLSACGGLVFLWWRQAAGFPSIPAAGIHFTDPVRGLWYAVTQWIAVHDLPTTLDVFSALTFLGLTVAMGINRHWRRMDWLIYTTLNLSVFLTKHSPSASSVQSMARYVLALFPAFIIVGDWLARQKSWLGFAYLALSGASLIVLSALYALWWFIG